MRQKNNLAKDPFLILRFSRVWSNWREGVGDFSSLVHSFFGLLLNGRVKLNHKTVLYSTNKQKGKKNYQLPEILI